MKMKIIEALKKIKDLKRKADDLKDKVKTYCADLDCETPVYADQKRQVAEWLQSHSDVLKEILSLRLAIARTNLETQVTIRIGDTNVTKSITEWIHRRKDLAKEEETIWRGLSDRGIKPTQSYTLTANTPPVVVKLRLYFDAAERDKKIDLYRTEPTLIDSTLEVINAVTDLK